MYCLIVHSVALFLLGFPLVAVAASKTLSWSPGAGGTPVGYIIERKDGAGAYHTVVQTVQPPPYIDTDVPLVRPVCYQVRAYNAEGVSAPSNEVCLVLPSAPVDLSVSTSGPNATLDRVKITATVRRKK